MEDLKCKVQVVTGEELKKAAKECPSQPNAIKITISGSNATEGVQAEVLIDLKLDDAVIGKSTTYVMDTVNEVITKCYKKIREQLMEDEIFIPLI